jgi:hypothetical protein
MHPPCLCTKTRQPWPTRSTVSLARAPKPNRWCLVLAPGCAGTGRVYGRDWADGWGSGFVLRGVVSEPFPVWCALNRVLGICCRADSAVLWHGSSNRGWALYLPIDRCNTLRYCGLFAMHEALVGDLWIHRME